ncbi:MAG: ankyrin repeat domain-containing protein [Acidobacteriota bacterium]
MQVKVKHITGSMLVALVALHAGQASAAGSRTSLVEAVKIGNAMAVRAVLKEQPALVNAAEPDGTTALHWATDRNDAAMTEILVRAGANVKAANRYGVTPIHAAAVNGNAAMIEMLLKAGADANDALPEGETALMTAARTGVVDALKVLLAHGADVNAKESWKQQTALMWAAHEGNAAAARLLIDAGAKVGDRSIFGWTPLLFAVRQGHIDAIKTLLECGASVNDTLPDGTGVLITAVHSLNYEAAGVLLEYGANPDAAGQGWTALHQIMWARRPQHGWRNPNQTPKGNLSSLDLVKKLVVEYGADINARETKEPSGDMEGRNNFNRYGATPFLLAAKNVDVPAMQALLQLGADPFLANVEGDTPLMVAAGVGVYSQGENPGQPEESADAVKLLLELGAPVSHVDKRGETAMHGPAWRGSNDTVMLLVDAGAKLDAKNQFGWSPLTIATGVYFNCRVVMNLHTAKLLRDLMTARGLDTSQAGINTNGQRPDQSAGVQGNIVVDDLTDAQNPSEVQEKLRAEMKRREEALRLLQQDKCP